MPTSEKHVLRFGDFELDVPCGQLRRNGVGIKLQGQPVEILEILLERPGELVTREELRHRLWSTDTFVDFDHSLNTAINRLRQALGDDAETPKYIETIPKRGYRFVAEVQHAPADHSTAGLATADENVERIAATLADAAITAGKRSDSSRVSHVVAVVAATVVALGAALYWITQPPPMPRIVRSYALTKTGFRKTPEFQSRVLTDGVAIYFQEARPSRVATMRVPAAGGEITELGISVSGSLRDISRDGSEALFVVPSPTGSDAWVQPLPAGTPRLIVKDARFPTWAADGRSILFVRRGDQELWRVNADGADARRLAESADISGIAVSPSGDHIRLNDGSTGTLWETGSGGSNPKAVLTQPAFGKWSPDGNYFFYSELGERQNLWVRSEERHWWRRNPPVTQLTFGPLSIGPPAISSDGKHLYARGREPHGELSVYDQHKKTFVPYLGGISACYVDFSRDGRWVAYVSYPEGTLWRSRVDGSERLQLTVPPMVVINPRWAPDGKLIAFWSLSPRAGRGVGSSPSRIYAVSADGGGPMLLPTSKDNPMDPTWFPDGKSIAYSTAGGFSGRFHEVWILDLATQKSSKVPGSDGLWSARWSPDGKYLAALGGNPSKLWLYTFATQKWSELVAGDPNFPSWSRDSRFVYAAQVSSRSLIGVSVSNREVTPIVSLAGVPAVAVAISFWVGVTPEGRPVTTRDTGIEEIYAFDLEYK